MPRHRPLPSRPGEEGALGGVAVIVFVLLAIGGGYLAVKIGPHYFRNSKLVNVLESDDFALAYRMPPDRLRRKVIKTARDIGLNRFDGKHVGLEYFEEEGNAVEILVGYSVLAEVIPGVYDFQKHFEFSVRRDQSGVAGMLEHVEDEVQGDMDDRAERYEEYLDIEDDGRVADGSGELTIIDAEDGGFEDYDEYDEEDSGDGGQPGIRRGITGYVDKARRAVRR